MVNITLRVLSKPDVEQLPRIFRVSVQQLGAARLLPGWLQLLRGCLAWPHPSVVVCSAHRPAPAEPGHGLG